MANSPQAENGHTDIANEIMDALAKTRIPGEARQVLDFILRKTYGWHKKKEYIPLSLFSKSTGMSKVAICKAIKKLVKMNLIFIKKGIVVTKNGNEFIASYCFNKHFNTWIPLPKKVIITQKGNNPLPNMDTLKEKVLKENTLVAIEEEIATIPPAKIKKEKPQIAEINIELAKLLDSLITENHKRIGRKRKQTSDSTIIEWADDIRKLIDIDKKDPEEVISVIKWCQDDDFWFMNILSGKKLRKQYDALIIKMPPLPVPEKERIFHTAEEWAEIRKEKKNG